MSKKTSEKYAKPFIYISIIVSIIMIYITFNRGGIKASLENGNWVITLGVVFTNIVNIYGGLSERKKGIDIVLNKARIQGSIIMLTTICIIDVIPRLFLKI